jgi:hypothetical protein
LLQKRYMNLKTSNFGPKYKPLCNNTWMILLPESTKVYV